MNKVMAYRLIARDTIEEKILELQDKKRALVKSVLPTGDGMLKALSIDEIENLFT
jgi:non-specific serine/threonine protein kinase